METPELARSSNSEAPIEFGSLFSFPHQFHSDCADLQFRWRLFGSGRDALLAAVQHGHEVLGWRRVLLPTYYCGEIHRRLRGHIEIGFYADNPVGGDFVLNPAADEVVVAVEYFGTRAHPHVATGPFIIDRTHAPLSNHCYQRIPEYVFGSLRKCAPVADGGYLISPKGGHIPRPSGLSSSHLKASALMLEAMCLKGRYLLGDHVAKGQFLNIYKCGESLLGSGRPAPMTPESQLALESFCLECARARVNENISRLRSLLAQLPPSVSLVPSESHFVLVARSAKECDILCRRLIDRNVFPAKLWPLDGAAVSALDRDLSMRLIAIHADFRYSITSIDLLASRIQESLDF